MGKEDLRDTGILWKKSKIYDMGKDVDHKFQLQVITIPCEKQERYQTFSSYNLHQISHSVPRWNDSSSLQRSLRNYKAKKEKRLIYQYFLKLIIHNLLDTCTSMLISKWQNDNQTGLMSVTNLSTFSHEWGNGMIHYSLKVFSVVCHGVFLHYLKWGVMDYLV